MAALVSSKTCGCLPVWMVSVIASSDVVPICAASVASVKSARVVASAYDESLSVMMACAAE